MFVLVQAVISTTHFTIPSAQAMQCTANSECDDGIACNGTETCELNRCTSHPLVDQSNRVYGSDNVQQQKLDFSAADSNPESNGCTFVVYIHGGGFTSGTRATFVPHIQWISKVLGYHAASIDYRLYNENTDQNAYPEQVSDVILSLNYLANQFGAKKFILAGHSAGGTLAALAALSKNNSIPATVPYPDAEIVGLIATAGTFDRNLLDPTTQILFDNWSDGYSEAEAINVAECADQFPTLLVAGAGDYLSPWNSSTTLNDLMVNSTATIVSGDSSIQCHNCVIKDLFLDANYNPIEPIPPAIPYIETFLNEIKNSNTSISCSNYSHPTGRACYEGSHLCIGCQTDSDCDNGDFCNGIETCVNQICQAGARIDCNDQDVSTVDSCDASSGCVHAANPICSNPPGTNLIFVGENESGTVASECINYSEIDGARFHFTWKQLEPEEDQYNWDVIYSNPLIQEWISKGKKISLGIDVVEDASAQGTFIPQWVFDAGVPVIEDTNAGTPKYAPYWNSIYKEKLHDLIRDFAQEFDTWEPLAMVRANGSNNAFEPTLAANNEPILMDQFIAQGFDGFKPNGVFAQAYNDMVRVYLESFVRTPVNLTIHFQNESNCAVLGDAKNGTNPEMCVVNGPVVTSCVSNSDCNDGDSCTNDSCLNNTCLNTSVTNCCKCEDQMHTSIHQNAITNAGLLGRKLIITNNGLNYQPDPNNKIESRQIFNSYFNQGQTEGIDISTGWSSLTPSDTSVTPLLLAWEALGDPSNPDPHFHTASNASVVIVGDVYCNPELYSSTQADAEAAIQWMKNRYPDRSTFENNYCAGRCQTNTDCTDNNACNGSETCNLSTGICAPGTPPSIDDFNPCTSDSCDSALGVQHTNVSNGVSCEDNDLCNGSETCQSGSCTNSAPLACDDGLFCNGSETCNATTGCIAGSNPCPNSLCDDTLNQCVACITDSDCEDNNACNGSETCNLGACVSGAPLACDDNNPCTSDSCDSINGCVNAPVSDGTDCGDGDVCNGSETCQSGSCTNSAPLACDDGLFCNGSETCDSQLGCVNDTLPCGNGSCDEDIDQCLSGCTQQADPNGFCQDGNACNGSETCNLSSGLCESGNSLTCDDNNPCTSDSCDSINGCVNAPVSDGTDCGDGDVCNGSETCQSGSCAAGDPLICSEGVFCDPTQGCQEPPALVMDGESGSGDGSGNGSQSSGDNSSLPNSDNSSNADSENNSGDNNNSSNDGFFANSGGVVLLANAQNSPTQNDPGVSSLNQSVLSSAEIKKTLPSLFYSDINENISTSEHADESGTALIFMGDSDQVTSSLMYPVNFKRSTRMQNLLKKSTRQTPLRIEPVTNEVFSSKINIISNFATKSDGWMEKMWQWICDVIHSVRQTLLKDWTEGGLNP